MTQPAEVPDKLEPDDEFMEIFKGMSPGSVRVLARQLAEHDLSRLKPVSEEARQRMYRAQAMAKHLLAELSS